jgi:putative DNA primase/helicase
MSAPQDAYALRKEFGGVALAGGRIWQGPGQGHSKHDKSLKATFLPGGGVVVHDFAGGDWRSGRDYLGLGKSPPIPDPERTARQRERDRQQAIERAADLRLCNEAWDAAEVIADTPAETYLWQSRGLIYDDGSELRFSTACPRVKREDPGRSYNPPPHPAMVARVTGPAGLLTGLHATYLTPKGCKAFGDRSRLMFGSIVGGAVRLHPLGADGVLAVAEGIETALAFRALYGVPAWAALSTAGLQNFQPPAGLSRLVIASDSDDRGAGLRAAELLAERARRRCEVVLAPAPEGKDWADVWKEGAHV